MPRPYVNDPHKLDRDVSPGLLRILLMAFGIALLIGMTSGAIWIGYNLVRIHALR